MSGFGPNCMDRYRDMPGGCVWPYCQCRQRTRPEIPQSELTAALARAAELEGEKARLREALEPLAQGYYDSEAHDDEPLSLCLSKTGRFKVGHFRWLRSLLAETAPDAPHPDPHAAGKREGMEEAARIAEKYPTTVLMFWDRPGSPPGNGYRPSTHADIAAAIRAAIPASGAPADEGWRKRAARVAERLEALIRAREPELDPEREPRRGLTLGHALFMAQAIQDGTDGVDTSTKACRWLGWLQCLCVWHGVASLDEMKEMNLASKNAAPASDNGEARR